ncbi:6047_t:CDS:2 [Ambispora leptoticha]|uniref:6047_t:CDS:1 n=1 Tax=Ambispora leptoticha TaxID=144679 RepID=A0A9N8VYU6_9GLOM|nr:6047_t:CDS:2 [Ambispora leptoticha]
MTTRQNLARCYVRERKFKNNSLLLIITIIVCLLSYKAPTTTALYFYLEGTEQKCFIEELPKDTLVVGNYKAELWSEDQKGFYENPDLGIQITVDELLAQGHTVVNQKGPSHGRFTFTAVEAGDHAICFAANASAWFSSIQTRLTLDMAIGETTNEEENDKEHFSELAQRVRDLNNRVADIRREQSYQREREAEFRDQSELTNSRVVYWSFVQLLVLGITCLFQMRHLRSFFEAKKLV